MRTKLFITMIVEYLQIQPIRPGSNTDPTLAAFIAIPLSYTKFTHQVPSSLSG